MLVVGLTTLLVLQQSSVVTLLVVAVVAVALVGAVAVAVGIDACRPRRPPTLGLTFPEQFPRPSAVAIDPTNVIAMCFVAI